MLLVFRMIGIFLPKPNLCSMFVLSAPQRRTPLSEPVEPAALRRDRSPEARSAARRRKAEREMRIVGFLNRCVSIAEIAAREAVSERGMRSFVEILGRRSAADIPAPFWERGWGEGADGRSMSR